MSSSSGTGAGSDVVAGSPGAALHGWRAFSVALGRALPFDLACSKLSRQRTAAVIARKAGRRG